MAREGRSNAMKWGVKIQKRSKGAPPASLYRPENILEANSTAKSPSWLAIWASGPAAATCSTVATPPAYPLSLNLLQTQPASLTGGFQSQPRTRQHRWRLEPAKQLATTSGGFHTTWLCTANSPLAMAVC